MAGFVSVADTFNALVNKVRATGGALTDQVVREVNKEVVGLVLETFEFGEPVCINLFRFLRQKIVADLLPLLPLIASDTAPFLSAVQTYANFPADAARVILYDTNSDFWTQQQSWDIWMAILSIPNITKTSGPDSLSSVGDMALFCERLFTTMGLPTGIRGIWPNVELHMALFRAAAVGLWNFRPEHPSVGMGLNKVLRANDIDQATQCFVSEALRNEKMEINHFDTLLAGLAQVSPWKEQVLVMSATDSRTLLSWLNTESATDEPSLQRFVAFLNAPAKHANVRFLIPILFEAHFVLGVLWWDKDRVQTAFLDSLWFGPTKHYRLDKLWRPFLTSVARAFEVPVAAAVVTLDDANIESVQDKEECGHIVLWLLDHLARKSTATPVKLLLTDLKSKAMAALDGKSPLKLLQTRRMFWAEKVILKNKRWFAVQAFLNYVGAQQQPDANEWPNWLMTSPMEAVEACGKLLKEGSAASKRAVGFYSQVPGIVTEDWPDSLPAWLPSPATLAGLVMLVSPSQNTPLSRAARSFLEAAFPRALLTQRVSPTAIYPYWQALSEIADAFAPVLDARVRAGIEQRVRDGTKTGYLRGLLAQAQTPLDGTAGPTPALASENVLASLVPGEFCWLGESKPPVAWRPMHWLDAADRPDRIPREAFDFLWGLVDVIDPVTKQLKAFLATPSAFQAAVERDPVLRQSWKTIGAAFAVDSRFVKWADDDMLEFCASAMVGIAEANGPVTLAGLARQAELFTEAIDLVTTLVQREDHVLDPRLLWGLSPDGSLTKISAADESSMVANLRQHFEDLAAELKLPDPTFGQFVADLRRLAQDLSKQRATLATLDPTDPHATAVLDKSEADSRLVGESLKNMASMFRGLTSFPRSWQTKFPLLSGVSDSLREYQACDAALSAVKSLLAQRRAEVVRANAELALDELPQPWQDFFGDVVPDLAHFNDMAEEEYAASPFGSREKRFELPDAFWTRYGDHLRRLDDMDILIGQLKSEFGRRLLDIQSARGSLDVIGELLELAVRQDPRFGRSSSTDPMEIFWTALLRQLFVADPSELDIVVVENATFAQIGVTLNLFRGALTVQTRLVEELVEDFQKSPAFQEARVWFKRSLETHLSQTAAESQKQHAQRIRRIATLQQVFGWVTPVSRSEDVIATYNLSFSVDATALDNAMRDDTAYAATAIDILLRARIAHERFSARVEHRLSEGNRTLSVFLSHLQPYVMVIEETDAASATKTKNNFLANMNYFNDPDALTARIVPFLGDALEEDDPIVEPILAWSYVHARGFKLMFDDAPVLSKALEREATKLKALFAAAVDEPERDLSQLAESGRRLTATYQVNMDGVLEELNMASSDALVPLSNSLNDAIDALKPKFKHYIKVAKNWKKWIRKYGFETDHGAVVQAILPAFDSVVDAISARRDASQKGFTTLLASILFPRGPAFRASLPAKYASEQGTIVFQTLGKPIKYPVFDLFDQQTLLVLRRTKDELVEVQRQYRGKNFATLQTSVGQFYETAGTPGLPRPALSRTRANDFADVLADAGVLLDHLPFVNMPPQFTFKADFIDPLQALFALTSSEALAQAAISLALATLAADPDAFFPGFPRETEALLDAAKGAYFNKLDTTMLVTEKLRKEAQGWVMATLDAYVPIALGYEQTEKELTEPLADLKRASVLEWNSLRFQVPSSLRARELFQRLAGRDRLGDLVETQRINKLLRVTDAMYPPPGPFRDLTARVSTLIRDVAQLEEERIEAAQNWLPWPPPPSIPIAELEPRANGIIAFAAKTSRDWLAFRNSAGPLGKGNFVFYEKQVEDTTTAFEALLAPLRDGAVPLMVLPAPGTVVTPRQEDDFSRQVRRLVDAMGRASDEVYAHLRDTQAALAAVLARSDRFTLEAAPRIQTALDWSRSRWYIEAYEDPGDATRPPWNLADEGVPGAERSWAKFGGARPGHVDEVMSATLFTEEQRDLAVRAERELQYALLRDEREREKRRALRALTKVRD